MSIDDASQRRREIGRRVARWRARCGLTRTQFADFCGRSLSLVDEVESGELGLPHMPIRDRVGEVLNLFCRAPARASDEEMNRKRVAYRADANRLRMCGTPSRLEWMR